MVNLRLEEYLARPAPVPAGPKRGAVSPIARSKVEIVPLPAQVRPIRPTYEPRSIWAEEPATDQPPAYRVPRETAEPRHCHGLRTAMADEAHNVLVKEGRKAVSFSVEQPNGGRIFLTATYMGPESQSE